MFPNSSSEITRVYIVRHGQTDFNKEHKIQGYANNSPENDINETGKKEASEVAQKLNKIAFDHVFSSDFNRALQTCDIITGGRPPVVDPRLRERNWKDWEGRLKKEFNADAEENWKHVESDQSVLDRALEVLNEIAEKCEGNVLLVTHGGFMRILLIQILNLDCQVEDIEAGNTAYYTLVYSESSWKLGEERDGLRLPGEA